MKNRNDVEVTINNKEYIITGYEGADYLQKIAAYINQKYREFKGQAFYGRLTPEMKSVLMNINVADDYFKALAQIAELEEFRKEDSRELFDIKHEKIALEAELKKANEQIAALRSELDGMKSGKD